MVKKLFTTHSNHTLQPKHKIDQHHQHVHRH